MLSNWSVSLTVVDYRRKKTDAQRLFIIGESGDFKFLGLTIEEDLPWSAKIIALVIKAQQTLYLTPQQPTLGEAAGAL